METVDLLFASDLENLIVLLAIMRARLQPRISYVCAENIAEAGH